MRFSALVIALAALATACGSDPAPVSASKGSGGGATGGASGGAGTTASTAGTGAANTAISAQYPGDVGIHEHPSVIFHSDFENGLDGFSSITQDTAKLTVIDDAGGAHGGQHYLQATITRAMLEASPYQSAQARVNFGLEDTLYWRVHVQFVGNTAPPHHWVKMAALSDSYSADGHAGYAPPGDGGFWYDFDVRDDDTFKFYTYWHEMRSWMCNDGSTDPSCAGYNGPNSNSHYGNNFHYEGQTPFPRDTWFCLELHGKSNTPGQYDGAVAYWLNGTEGARYQTGEPNGRWLRDSFYSHGQYFVDEGPFEGFNFRTSSDVGWRMVVLDAYYQKDTLDAKEATGYPVPDSQIIRYDDLVIATERVGCKQ